MRMEETTTKDVLAVSDSYIDMDMDTAVEPYINELPCLSLDKGMFKEPYADFYKRPDMKFPKATTENAILNPFAKILGLTN